MKKTWIAILFSALSLPTMADSFKVAGFYPYAKVGDEGMGRARLTEEGTNLMAAMAWL